MENTEIKDVVIAVKPNLNYVTKDGTLHRLISEEDEAYLDSMIVNIRNYMAMSSVNIDSENSLKDSEYEAVKTMWNEASGRNLGRLNKVLFRLPLYRKEFKYITELFLEKLDYTIDTVFYAIELTDSLGKLEQVKYKTDNEVKLLEFTALDLTYMYHILSKTTVKGLNQNTYAFVNVIKSIIVVTKIFDYYKNEYEILVKDIQNWAANFSQDVESGQAEMQS